MADESVPHDTVALRHPEPRRAYAEAAAAMFPEIWPEAGVHERAWVHDDAHVEGATIDAFAVVEAGARVAPGTWIQAHAYIGRGVRLGERCRIMPGAVVMDGTVCGDRVWVHPGAVVGTDGFGHVRTDDGMLRVPQLGTAELGDDVGIGANACVDRAALGATRVGAGTHIDNLVQIAHGAELGRECALAAFAGVAGGAVLGDRVLMAGRTAVVDGVRVGDDVVFAGLASARKDVNPGAKLGGSPARAYRTWLRETAALKQLPGVLRTLRTIQARVDALERDDDAS